LVSSLRSSTNTTGDMSGYRTMVGGTDGSDSSLRAVDRAGAIAASAGAKLIVATAYFPPGDATRGSWGVPPGITTGSDVKGEGYKMTGNAPIYAILRDARDRAKPAGATDIEEKAVVGAPVDALVDLAVKVKADLLVVGNVGLSTIAGRLLGSVPANVARRSKTDVLIVHTTP
jgi:nucleotide-binding universal stress UspA family protein